MARFAKEPANASKTARSGPNRALVTDRIIALSLKQLAPCFFN
ncbi:MAG: hypothetical protein ABSD38_15710 [Syntrophorhabdales bacterium]